MTGIFTPVRPRRRGGWLWLTGIILAALLLFLPLRLALGIAGDTGLAARAAGGTVWSGRLIDAQLGAMAIGTLDTRLRPLSLPLGRLRFDAERLGGAPLAGSGEFGWNRRAVHDLTGTISGGALGDVPLEQVQVEALTVVFNGGRCIEARGRVRLVPGLDMAGAALRNGLSGTARCDNGVLLLPLAGDSGLERLVLRVRGDGRYSGTLGTGSAAPVLRVEGRL